MAYAVHHRNASGVGQLEDFEELAQALERVEQLRNEDGASEVRVFREVPIEVKTYYKVVALESDGGGSADNPPPGAMPLSPPLTARPAAAAAEVSTIDDTGGEEPSLDTADDTSRRTSLFNRG